MTRLEEIDAVLSKIATSWKRFPELRLGQLLLMTTRKVDMELWPMRDRSLARSLDMLTKDERVMATLVDANRRFESWHIVPDFDDDEDGDDDDRGGTA